MTQDIRNKLRFLVIQVGARMHYAVPALLAEIGMLESFYTDIHAEVPFVKLLGSLFPERVRPKFLKRLFGRTLPHQIPKKAVKTVSFRSLLFGLLQFLRIEQFFRIDPERVLLRKILRDGFGNANAIYTNCVNSDLEVVREAKRRGLFIIHEVILNPKIGYVLAEESANLLKSEIAKSQIKEIESGNVRDCAKWDLADLILVPSDYVLTEVIKLGADQKKIVKVPYGIREEWFSYRPEPREGCVLFVGTVGLLKGSHYLAMAARILKERGLSFQARVIGPYDKKMISRPEFLGPLYLGQMPRSEVIKEFLSADIFVLPTLCDSFGLVLLEALACGVPVITTPHCGSVVRDGVDGFIVPLRDAKALADRIELLLTDGKLRDVMSANARLRAREFSWEKYKENLLKAIFSIKTGPS